jgi:hypothetical protein
VNYLIGLRRAGEGPGSGFDPREAGAGLKDGIEEHWFDDLTRAMAGTTSRRQALKTVAATALTALTGGLASSPAAARGEKCYNSFECPGPCDVCWRSLGDQITGRPGVCIAGPTGFPGQCPAGQCCIGGNCSLPPSGFTCGTAVNSSGCPSGQARCFGHCISLSNDPNNCGGCGNACGVGSNANNPTCCGETCTDIQSDPANCGGCGSNYACSGGRVCSAGQCGCPTGQTDCGGTCTDTRTDRNNCGGCSAPGSSPQGMVCSSEQVCSGGTCLGGCPEPCGADQTCCVNPTTNIGVCVAADTCCGGLPRDPSTEACCRTTNPSVPFVICPFPLGVCCLPAGCCLAGSQF